MNPGRPSNSFYPLLSVVHLLAWGYSGIDARRLLASDARPGIYNLLTDSSDIRTEVIQLCFSVDMVITLLEELNVYDNDRSARYVDPLALLIVSEIDTFIGWYLRSGRSLLHRWYIRKKIACLNRSVAAARDTLQIANVIARSRLPRREDSNPSEPSDPQRRDRSQSPPFSSSRIAHRGPAVYVTQVIGSGNVTGNCHWYQ